ncbi:MAG: hypothetical protein J07HX64_01203 [halophilic archaeon J07HX64]|nr:MAG: hypothetical protein J07HX64_01203 [halophilic archaeon J07HX64]
MRILDGTGGGQWEQPEVCEKQHRGTVTEGNC